MIKYLILLLCLLTTEHTFSQHKLLEKEIKSIIKGKKATVGVAVLYNNKELLTINNRNHYPLLSVVKFHLALTVLNHLDKNNCSLDTEIHIAPSDLLPNTYSPLRNARPEGNFNMPIRELLKYSIAQSDNNACDILFKYVGGTQVVEQYIKSLGIEDLCIRADEAIMHEQFENQYFNWTTPSAAVQLLNVFMQKELFAPVYKDFLINTMIGTITGGNKIKGLLPENIIVGHKTGSSDRNSAGKKIADNDIGFIRLPNGKQFILAIFVMDSMESDTTNANIIAAISKAVYNHMK